MNRITLILPERKEFAERYRIMCRNEPKTIFLGRLAEYRYYDMDDVIRRALDEFQKIREKEHA